jgi:hypothetical protein
MGSVHRGKDSILVRLVILGVAVSLVAALSVMWRSGERQGTALAQQDADVATFDDAPVNQVDTAAMKPLPPPDPAGFPGIRHQPRPQPPPILTESEVEAGVAVRLQRMHDKQAARDVAKRQTRRGFGATVADEPPFDREPPREPEPPPPPEALE